MTKKYNNVGINKGKLMAAHLRILPNYTVASYGT